ncbi:hypothetical protein N8I77_010610 [Diaporthe amygdali]|uniref:Heterokaryon incompatibility domain-containing protein n=1 Tax=Phomopsis amygdali TaxID=1214568 RepID=A0AAD9S7E4_PHOAM|nr:hypothetical protein N8I77_010610 [Diaporthe amygdali]
MKKFAGKLGQLAGLSTTAAQRKTVGAGMPGPAAENTTTISRSWRQWAEEPYPKLLHEGGANSRDQLEPVFQYNQLDETADSTRLLQIKPHLRTDGLLDCSLVTVKFGDRPKFDALSYMWGDSSVRKKICVNGAEFEVTENLFDALHFLRRRPEPKEWLPIWIDAICIDQQGIAEKDRQLPFMPHIYERAQQVLVWLGRGYEKFQAPDTEDLIRRELHWRHGGLGDDLLSKDFNMVANYGGDYVFKDSEKAMAGMLRADRYWDRVWIIQEIGKARRIMVCFGKITLNWAEFICFVCRFERGDHGPKKFNDMNKSRQSRKLKDLLEQHQRAQCALPKDKIYGLLGLALDSGGFPVHYDQSDLSTWVDTLDFAARRGLVPMDQTISFARMVSTLLFDHPTSHAPDPSTLDTIPKSKATDHSASTYPLGAFLIGWVEAIGPSTSEIFSNLDALNKWNTDQFDEGDRLRRSLLDTDDDAIKTMLASGAADLLGSAQHPSLIGNLARSISPLSSAHKSQVDEGAFVSGSSSPARIFKLYPQDADASWTTFDNSKLGVISNRARRGDIICYLKELREMFVLRRDDKEPNVVRIVGKGLLTNSVISGKPLEPPKGNLDGLGKVSINVDAKTLWQLAS